MYVQRQALFISRFRAFLSDALTNDDYRNGITAVEFQGYQNGSSVTAEAGNITLTAQHTYDNSQYAPHLRWFKDDVQMECNYVTTVSGSLGTTRCDAEFVGANGDSVSLRLESYLPPDYVMKSFQMSMLSESYFLHSLLQT